MKLALLVSIVLCSAAHAEGDGAEFLACTKYKDDVHAFIECLSTARDEWDRLASKHFGELLEKVDDIERRKLYVIAKKQRELRYTKCGQPNPVTVHAAECQRAMAEEQSAEIDRAATALSK